MRPRILIALLFSAAFVAITCNPAGSTARATSSVADQAVTFQGNVTHTGSPIGDVLAPPLIKRWSRDLGFQVPYALIAGGTIYVTTMNNPSALYALNEQTGATVWTASLANSALAAYDAGSVYTVTSGGLMQAFNATTGQQRWSAVMPGQYSFSSPPVASNGTVYVGGAGSGGTVYAVSESNGVVPWTASVMNGDASSPALSATNAFVSYACPQVYSFAQAGGALSWHYSGPVRVGAAIRRCSSTATCTSPTPSRALAATSSMHLRVR